MSSRKAPAQQEIDEEYLRSLMAAPEPAASSSDTEVSEQAETPASEPRVRRSDAEDYASRFLKNTPSEAQNTTREQMKMFLTRLGFGSKIVITGDVTQIDLPDDKVSGLKDAVRVLDGVKDIAICRLTAADVVRHALVQEIISAYERSAQKKEVKKPTRQIQGRYHQRKN